MNIQLSVTCFSFLKPQSHLGEESRTEYCNASFSKKIRCAAYTTCIFQI